MVMLPMPLWPSKPPKSSLRKTPLHVLSAKKPKNIALGVVFLR
jgi:hypothetical protein